MSLFEKKPTVWIPCKNLAVIWPKAQRTYKPERAKLIADNFDPDKFGVLHVTKPNGNGIFHVYEGQHRKHALEMKYGPDEKAPCIVADDIDEQRAAELFLGINASDARKSPTQIDVFKVSVTAERADYVAVNDIITRLGYRVAAGEKSGKGIAACNTLISIYGRYGAEILRTTLITIKDTWGYDSTAVSASILSGYAAFIREFGHHADLDRLVSRMEKAFTPGRLLGAAKTFKESGMAPNGTAAVVEILLKTYNTGLRADNVLKRKGGK